MYKNRFFMQLSVFLFSLFLLSGCGANNSQNSPITAPDNTTTGGGSTDIASLTIMNSNTDVVTVAKDSQNVSIAILALDKNSLAVDGAAILVQYPDKPLGSFSTKTVALNAGIASFVYTAPSNLKGLIDSGITQEQFTFYAYDSESKKADTSVKIVLTVKFDLTADSESDDSIVNIVLTPQRYKVTQASQKVNIQVNAYNKNGYGVKNDTLRISDGDIFNTGDGNYPNSVTIINGVGSFIYTAPVDFPDKPDLIEVSTSTISSSFGSVSQMLTIEFGPRTTTPTLSVDNGSTRLTGDGENVDVLVLAKDSAGVPLQKGSIEVLYPSGSRLGTFSQAKVAINNGVARFSYTGPTPLVAQAPKTFTFRFVENTSVTTTWTVAYVPTTPAVDPIPVTYPIDKIIVNKDITASSSGQTETIKVLALMSDNSLVPEGKIRVTLPDEVTSRDIGTISPREVDIVNGYATFTYTAPTPLVSAEDVVFTFTSVTYHKSDTMTVSFSPQIDPAHPVANTLNILNGNDVDITKNGEIINIRTRVFGADNNPYDGGNVLVRYPATAAIDGTDVGSFASLSVACVNGVADFTYNAPSNIAGRSDSFDFVFYHDSEGSSAESTLHMHMLPDPDQIVLINYELGMSASDGNNTMGLNQSKTFTVAVTDEKGNVLSSDANYTITNMNSLIADINDTKGNAAPLTIVGKNANFSITSNKKSGVLPIGVSASFIDENGQAQTISQTFNVVIYSGPPTAISISYVGTEQDKDHAQFIEIFSIKLTDKYNNPVNTSPMIHVAGMAGYAKDKTVYPPIESAAKATRDGVYTPIPASANYSDSHLYNGNLFALREDADISNYSDSQTQVVIGNTMDYDITDLDTFNNVLVTFGDGYVYHKSGKWDIDFADEATDTLILDEEYNNTSNGFDMGFAIGNNFRQDTCRFGEEWVLTTESDDGTYRVDSNGYARVRMPYDYYLVGKDVIVYANLVGDVLRDTDITARVGEAKKVTLRGHELTPYPVSYRIPKDSDATRGYIFAWRLKETEEWYRNANFGGFEVTVTGDGASCSAVAINDYRNCENDGVAFIEYECRGGDSDGTISMSDAVVRPEFLY